MLYVTSVIGSTNKEYLLFETHSESIITAKLKHISNLLDKHGMVLKNATIINGDMINNNWPHEMKNNTTGFGKYYNTILLTKITDNLFKTTTRYGTIEYVTEAELKTQILKGLMSNCNSIIVGTDTVFRSIDTYKTNRDEKFEIYIEDKCKKYEAKTKLLGLNAGLKYRIDGREVKIIGCKGTSKVVIIPDFVTAITEGAFKGLGITDVKIGTGLEYIGSNAFMFNAIKHIEIPKTVKFISSGAFAGNMELYKINVAAIKESKLANFNEANFKVESKRTIILDKIFKL